MIERDDEPTSSDQGKKRGALLSTVILELRGAGLDVALHGSDVRVFDVEQDSRRVAPGSLFVSRTGSQNTETTATFLSQAEQQGASALLVDDVQPSNLPQIVLGPALDVPDGRELAGELRDSRRRMRIALGFAASAVHDHPSYVVEVLAVTGTNGKTTTTQVLADALDALAGRPDALRVGTVGARLGEARRTTTHTTPEGDELARLLGWARKKNATHAAVEASSHALDQERLAGTRIRAAGFTNLTQDHLDYHETMPRYFAAKARLFEELSPGHSVVCVDDEWGQQLASRLRSPLLRVSTKPAVEADLMVQEVRLGGSGLVAVVKSPAGLFTLQSTLVGRHNLQNLMVALGLLLALDVPAQDAIDALAQAKSSAGRLERVVDPLGEVLVFVDYAHSPDALERVLATVRDLTSTPGESGQSGGRVFCVFGCGGDRDVSKRPLMGQAVVSLADIAVVTNDNPRTEDPEQIAHAVLEGMGSYQRVAQVDLAVVQKGVVVELDRSRAIHLAIAAARPGDVVLVAGKGHEDYQIIGREKLPFDDVTTCAVALAIAERLARRSGLADGVGG